MPVLVRVPVLVLVPVPVLVHEFTTAAAAAAPLLQRKVRPTPQNSRHATSRM